MERKKNRIAMILPNLNCGGVENVACNMSRMFSRNGYEVYFFLNTYNKEKSFDYSGKIKVVPYKMWETESKSLIFNLVTVLDQALLLKKMKEKYKINISISFHPYNHILNVLSDCSDKKLITIHEVTSCSAKRLKYFYYSRFFYKFLYKKADKIITVSQYCKWDLCKNMRMKKKNIQVLPNAIDERRLNEELQEEVSFDTDHVIVAIGRLEEDKQQWHIIHAFKEVLAYDPSAILVVVGEGNLKHYLIGLTKKLNIEKNVIFTGFQKNVGAYLKKAEILVLSSAAEAFPCVIQEALYIGTPVVANDCEGGVRELLSNKKVDSSNKWYYVDGGIITPKLKGKKQLTISEEEKQMGEAIVELIKNEAKRKEISKNCRRMALKYEEKRIEKKWINLFDELADN